MRDRTGRLRLIGLTANMIERVEQEAARAAGGIEDDVLPIWVEHGNGEGD